MEGAKDAQPPLPTVVDILPGVNPRSIVIVGKHLGDLFAVEIAISTLAIL